MNDLTSTKIDFLKSIGSDKVNHAGDQTLLDHLVGTMDKLRDMGKPEYLQDAGLFHSVYGTAYFMTERNATCVQMGLCLLVIRLLGSPLVFL